MIPDYPIHFHPFDHQSWLHRYRTNLPHWRQPNATYFVTFRLADSIPRSVFQQWEKEKLEWLAERGLSLSMAPSPSNLPAKFRKEFERKFNRKLHSFLDGGRGTCVLRIPEAREHLEDGFRSSASTVGSYVIMPNHVHCLITPRETDTLQKTLQLLKGGTARRINKALGRTGKLWQRDSFDHIVRTFDHLERYQKYIRKNPEMARLDETEYSLHIAQYTSHS